MKNSTLAQATLLALTRQNVVQRKAPISTYTVRAVCVTRNIKEGEAVIVQQNSDGTINRLSNMPSTNTPFFVDAKNRIYDRISSGDILRIRDGLSGEVIDQGQHAYKIAVRPGVLGYCIEAKTSDHNEIWKYVFEDGSVTKPIETPVTSSYTTIFGYRNGILAIANGYSGACDVWTYTKSGEPLYALQRISVGYAPGIQWVVPISSTSVGVGLHTLTSGGIQSASRDVYAVAYTDHVDNYGHIYANYHGYNQYANSTGTWLGHDQSYIYLYHRLHDPDNPSTLLDDYVVCRFSIDDFSGAETVEQFTGARSYSSVNNRDHLNVRYGGNSYVVDRATMGQAFSGELDLASNTTINMMENDGYIWDSPSGIYQKTALGTVMWASSIYPKSSPYGQLGYALYNVNVGSVGEAVILFS